MKVTVIDYGLSNLLSVRHAFAHFGAETLLTSDPADVLAAEKLVLPGVGAFKDGMDGLARLGLIEPIRQKAAAGTPLLGICLGMQMLFDESEEFGLHKGLGLIPGRVVKIPDTDVDGHPQKVPHISWDPLYPGGGRTDFSGTALAALKPGEECYFIHSYESLLYNFCAAVLRAFGDTKKPFFFLSISGTVNVLLNLFFVVVCRLGVAGVAIATVVSQYLALALVLICLMRLEGCAQLELKKLRFYPDEALRMIQIGLPAGLQSVIFNISNVMIQSSINSFGADVVAANTAAGNLDSFIYTACNSVYHASMTFTSQNLGAGRPERIKPVYRDCILTVLLIGVPMCALLYFFGHPLLGIYIARDDPAYASVIASGMVRVTYMGMTYFVCGIMETCCGMVRGLGRSWMPMVVTIFGACVLRIIWIYTIFQTHHTLDVLYLSYPVSWVVTSAVHVLCFVLIYRRMMARWNAHKEEENASY